MSAVNQKTKEEIVDAFSMSEKHTFHMSDSNFENGCLAAYGKRIEILESSNDTTHEVNIREKDCSMFDADELAKIVEEGYCECWRLHTIFQDLVNKGILDLGSYFVRVCW